MYISILIVNCHAINVSCTCKCTNKLYTIIYLHYITQLQVSKFTFTSINLSFILTYLHTIEMHLTVIFFWGKLPGKFYVLCPKVQINYYYSSYCKFVILN